MAVKVIGTGAAAAFLVMLLLPFPASATTAGAGLIRVDFTLRPGVEPAPASGFGLPARCAEALADDIVVCGRPARGASLRVRPQPRRAGDRVRGEAMAASDVIDIGGIGCSTVGTPYGCGRVNLLAIVLRAAELVYRKLAGETDDQPDWARMAADMIPLDDR
ncbi:MAG TPA: hypothetical protein VEC11_11750 [Allosphingosinicella sp.]|nr:hypothetical protein [Allosphingosinicella sp.]